MEKIIEEGEGHDIDECKLLFKNIKANADELLEKSGKCSKEQVEEIQREIRDIHFIADKTVYDIWKIKDDLYVCVKHIEGMKDLTEAVHCINKVIF